MGKLKGKRRVTKSRGVSGGGVSRTISSAASSLGAVMGVTSRSRGGGGGGRRRRKGPTYWANKVLVAKLKKRYYRLQYGGAR